MSAQTLGATPSVLRCSRCGRFVDWEDARLQLVCGCRPQLALPPVYVREAAPSDLEATLELFKRDFGDTRIFAFGEEIVLEHAPAIVAEMKAELAGALTYRLAHPDLQ